MKQKAFIKIRLFLVGLLFFNGVFVLLAAHKQFSTTKRQLARPSSLYNSLKFDDPITALNILEQLDIYVDPIQSDKAFQKAEHTISRLNFTLDKDYCKKHRAFLVNHPEIIFQQNNIFWGRSGLRSLPRTRVIPKLGIDLVTSMKIKFEERIYDLPLNLTVLWSSLVLHAQADIGMHYSCLSQATNSIPGAKFLHRKDFVSEMLVKYATRYESKPQCFPHEKFFPKTWILYRKEQCKEFFENIMSPEYEKLKKDRHGIVYMRKVAYDSHQGTGIFPVDSEEEKYIRTLYGNGSKCGIVQDNNIIQHFIHNPLLINGHKSDLRAYLLIASTNPILAFYSDGYIRVSLDRYDPESNERASLITNIDIAMDIFKIAAQNGDYQGKTLHELIHSHQWTYEKLQNYLLEAGIINDPHWLDNYFRPEMMKAMTHLVRMSQDKFMKNSSLYLLLGLDFMLDSDLNLWFIEANRDPGYGLEEDPEEIKQIDSKMLIDLHEIVIGLLKSRMKRVVQFVNYLTEQSKHNNMINPSSEDAIIENLEEMRHEFYQMTRNYFEKEFEMSSDNGFRPIVNDHYYGVHRYFGLLDEECII